MPTVSDGNPARLPFQDQGQHIIRAFDLQVGAFLMSVTDQSPPFFIVGCGRSGTTLLRTLLNRHPEVSIPLESLFIVDYLRVRPDWPLDELLPMLVREPEIREWGLHVGVADLEGLTAMAEVIDRLHRLYSQRQGGTRWGQKTPRFVRHLDLLHRYFPEAKFIHLVRDPRAVVNSLTRSDVHHSNAYYATLRWLRDVGRGLEFEGRHPELVLRLKYESLVRKPSDQLQLVARFLALDWLGGEWWVEEEQATAEYSEFYDQIHANLDRGISQEHADKWRTSLEPWEVELVEALTHEKMISLGYQVTQSPREPASLRIAALRIERLFGLLRQTVKYLRQRRAYLIHLLYRKWRLGLLRDFLWNANF